jgi:hypothetical protein
MGILLMSDKTFEEISEQAMNLPLRERIRLVERLVAAVGEELEHQEAAKPRRSLLGLLADLGPAPSAEDIDEVRREMWKNFPRKDI